MTQAPDDVLVDVSSAASAATANLTGPPPSSEAPGPIQEPPEQSGSDDTAAEDEQYQPVEFDPRWKEPFTGLMYLGRLEKTVTIWGHLFQLATPSQLEMLQVGELHRPYQDTMAAEIAYQTLMVAAYLTAVDGQELPKPVLNDPKENAVRDRFKWVTENLKRAVIQAVYEDCLILMEQVDQVLDAMGEARG